MKRKYSGIPSVYTQSHLEENYISKETHSKKLKTYTLISLLLICLSGYIGYEIGENDLIEDLKTLNEARIESSLSFDVNIDIYDSPLDIVVNISNIESSDPIISQSYKIENVTGWVHFRSETSSYSFSIDHSLYYDILNLNNNTVVVKMSNTNNITISRFCTFSL